MSEILKNLKNRKRPTVEARDASLLVNSPAEPLDSLAAPTPQSEKSKQILTELEHLPVVAPRRQIRLEETIDQAIEQLCQNQPRGQRITIETFLESAYVLCQKDPKFLKQVLDEAVRRYSQRKRAGQLRRIQSQLNGKN